MISSYIGKTKKSMRKKCILKRRERREMRSVSCHPVSYWSQSNLIFSVLCSLILIRHLAFVLLLLFLLFLLLLFCFIFDSMMIMMMRMWQDHFVLLIPPPMTNIMRIQFNQSESQLDRTSWFVSIDVSDQERRTKEEKERKIFHFLLSIEIELIRSASVFSVLFRLGNSSSSCIEWEEKNERAHVSWMNTNEHPRENLIITYFNFFPFHPQFDDFLLHLLRQKKIVGSSSGNALRFLVTRRSE